MRNRFGKDKPNILRILIQKVRDGDLQAIKIILDRTHPLLKAHTQSINISIGNNLGVTSGNVLSATLSSEIPGDVGATLFADLASHIKIVEADKPIRRVVKLWKRHPNVT